jgi:hypothetical protein
MGPFVAERTLRKIVSATSLVIHPFGRA